MVSKMLFMHELEALESSLTVLGEAAQAIRGPVDHVDFLRQEVPLAIEDAQNALRQLRALAAAMEEAA